MSSVGETLRRERARKNLTLDQVAHETRISSRFLEAIEQERFDRLPGGVFARSFVRQYAKFLGLDDEELAAEIKKLLATEEEAANVAQQAQQPAYKVPKIPEFGGRSRPSSSTWAAFAMVVAVMLICAVIYGWWTRSRRSAPAPQPASQTATAPAPKPAEPKPAETKPAESAPFTPPAAQDAAPQGKTEEAPPTQTAAATATPPASAPSANPAATLHVSLSADSPTWVRAWADGKEVMTATLQPNETKTVDAVDGIRLRTGNAGDLHVTLNGKPVGPIGPKGQIRIVQVTSHGVQVEAPLKPEAPPAASPQPL